MTNNAHAVIVLYTQTNFTMVFATHRIIRTAPDVESAVYYTKGRPRWSCTCIQPTTIFALQHVNFACVAAHMYATHQTRTSHVCYSRATLKILCCMMNYAPQETLLDYLKPAATTTATTVVHPIAEHPLRCW